MAYNKLVPIIELATELQASSTGLTIKQMIEKTERSRKTIERMLAGLHGLGLESRTSVVEGDHHLEKRWHLDGLPSNMLGLKTTERSALERHLRTMHKGAAKEGLTKLLAGQEPLSKHLAIDQDILIERSAYIGRVGPRNPANEKLMLILENALSGFEEVRLLYRASDKPKAIWRKIRPLGMLFSRFGYLVGSVGDKPPKTYRLDLIKAAELTGTYYRPSHHWSFKNWVTESFGVFHGDETLKIKLRFNKVSARRAESVKFHPSQSHTKKSNGDLIVHLTCQGHRELIHELCHPDWLGNVFIEEPEVLKIEYLDYINMLQKALRQ